MPRRRRERTANDDDTDHARRRRRLVPMQWQCWQPGPAGAQGQPKPPPVPYRDPRSTSTDRKHTPRDPHTSSQRPSLPYVYSPAQQPPALAACTPPSFPSSVCIQPTIIPHCIPQPASRVAETAWRMLVQLPPSLPDVMMVFPCACMRLPPSTSLAIRGDAAALPTRPHALCSNSNSDPASH